MSTRQSFMGRTLTLAAAYKSTNQRVFVYQIRDMVSKQLGRASDADSGNSLLDILFEQAGAKITREEAAMMAAAFQVSLSGGCSDFIFSTLSAHSS